jgi:hypothetical protein
MPSQGSTRGARNRGAPNVHGKPRTRWDTDAGVTERDAAALYWIGQQYTARFDTLRVLLGRLSPGAPRDAELLGESTVRQILDRWAKRKLIVRERLLGHLWVAPTGWALGLVGLEVRSGWKFSVPMMAHYHAVGVVRLALDPAIPEGGRWVSERELRRDSRADARCENARQLPDGAVEVPPDPDAAAGRGMYGEAVYARASRYGIEVELTRKYVPELMEKWQRPRGGSWKHTTYYAPHEVAGYLRRHIEELPSEYAERLRVLPLPEVPGVAYMRPGGGSA